MLLRALILTLLPVPAFACDQAICRADPERLNLTQIITFDALPSGWDPGHPVDELLVMDGASFAERFTGQALGVDGDFDTVSGEALPPLTLVPGNPGQTFSITRSLGSNILNGYGPAGFPQVHAQGEGAIAVLFDEDQPALSFQMFGLENGFATIQFLRRNGTVIHTERVRHDGPIVLGFRRLGDISDIAGLVITNRDPQGVAIDNLRFSPPPVLG